MNKNSKIALATVTTENYVQWTMVMIHSFLKSNNWFAGDIVVFCVDLSSESRVRLGTYDQVILIRPSEMLLQRLNHLKITDPRFQNIASQFYSLEVFNLDGYDKVLFLDSDVIVVESLVELYGLDAPIAACPESCWYFGKGRNASDYNAVAFEEASGDFIACPINSGAVLIDGKMINQVNYNGLLNLVSPSLWSNKETLHADQMVLNFWFRNQFKVLDSRYNYRPKNARQIAAKDHIGLNDALIIHFIRQYKPWNFTEMMASSEHDIGMVAAYEFWFQWYFDFLKHNHLRMNITLNKSEKS